LYYYLSKQIPEVPEIPEKPVEEVVKPEEEVVTPPSEEVPPEEVPPEEKLIVQKCTDGTPYGQCSTNKPKYCENGSLIDKAYLCGCPLGYEVSNDQCAKIKEIVLLIVDEYLYRDNEIKSRIDRYKEDNKEYEFKEILFNKTDDSIVSMNDIGGDIKHNSLELRNTIKQMYHSFDKKVVGIWMIGNIRPTIWRDANLWRDLGVSGFYPSIYPLIAIDKNYYIDFDVKYDGFYEKKGVTTGSEIGGGYNATIWGATLIPPTPDRQLGKELIKDYFDRNHAYQVNLLRYDKKLLYSNIWGCSSAFLQKIDNSLVWGDKDNVLLCPNFHPELQGFNSMYSITIGPGAGVECQTEEEKNEFESWISQDYFGDSYLTKFSMPDMPYMYYFLLHLKGRSISVDKIKKIIKNNLPPIICSRLNCNVYVEESSFEEEDGSWDGRWISYPAQRDSWTRLYDSALKNNQFLLTYVSAHGGTKMHDFNISTDKVKNANYSSVIYQIESCNAANYLVENYIAGNYLFYGNALVVSGFSVPYLTQGRNNYFEESDSVRFLKISKGKPIVNALFLKNYGNCLYLGDPLLELPY